MANQCSSCRFWRADPNSGAFDAATHSFGQCRRYPPRISDHMASIAIGSPGARGHIDLDKWTCTDVVYDACLSPVTFFNDWCGEFSHENQMVPV